MGPGVIAVGVGERTTPAGFERFARQVLGAGLAEKVLAVPIVQERATMHLDTIVTMVDVDTVMIYPNMASRLRARQVTWEGDLVIGQEGSFFEIAASAMGRPTNGCANTASTSWRSADSSWGQAGVARAACRAPSCGTDAALRALGLSGSRPGG